MNDEITQAIISALTGFILFAAGFIANTITGKHRADVRETNAKARESEAKSEITAFELAQKALREVSEMQAREHERDARIEALEKENGLLKERVKTLESENGQLRGELEKVSAENAELKRRLDRGRGLAMK